MTIVLLIFVALGFLSPAYRGSILQAMLLLFTFMGIFAGYTSARFYKMMKVRAYNHLRGAMRRS